MWAVSRIPLIVAPAALPALPLLVAGCAPGPPATGLDARAPADRIQAARAAAEADDAAAIRPLVEQLDCDDAVVRLVAADALERLTGLSRGYVYDDPVSERRAAIQRWMDALEDADGLDRAGATSPSRSGPTGTTRDG